MYLLTPYLRLLFAKILIYRLSSPVRSKVSTEDPSPPWTVYSAKLIKLYAVFCFVHSLRCISDVISADDMDKSSRKIAASFEIFEKAMMCCKPSNGIFVLCLTGYE